MAKTNTGLMPLVVAIFKDPELDWQYGDGIAHGQMQYLSYDYYTTFDYQYFLSTQRKHGRSVWDYPMILTARGTEHV